MSRASGYWNKPFEWPLIGIHTIITPDNKILTFGTDLQGNQSGLLYYDVWNPATNVHYTLNNVTQVDMFCAVALVIPATDKIMIAGGDARPVGDTGFGVTSVNHYDYRNMTLVKAPSGEMEHPRWYPTAVTLANGTILVLGGKGGAEHGGDGASPYPELYTPGVGWKMLTGAAEPSFETNWNYPRAWLKSNGEVVVYGPNSGLGKGIYSIDPTGDGAVRKIGELPFAISQSGPAVMFAPDKVLALAVKGNLWQIDYSGAAPRFALVGNVGQARQWSNMTVLADGSVMINGGSVLGNDLATAVKQVAIWDPDTRQVTFGASESTPRLYHSSTIMLPNAKVLSLGGGAPGPLTNLNGEIYNPGYLYNPEGGLAQRPAITSGPKEILPSGTFKITVDNASDIDRLTFVKNGSVTHSFNMDTRFVELPFTVASNTLTVDHPDNANLLTPGRWMLFAIDDNGVPSVAKTIKVKIGGQTFVAAAESYATFSGDATQSAGGSFALRSAPAGNRGAVLFNDAVDLSDDLSFSFDVQLGDCSCGDGVTFLLHTNPHGEDAPAQVVEAGGLRLQIGAIDGAGHHERHGRGDHTHDAYDNHNAAHADPGDHSGGAAEWRLTKAVERELAEDVWHHVRVFWNAREKSLSYTINGRYAGTLADDLLGSLLDGETAATFGFVGARLRKGPDCHMVRLIGIEEDGDASRIIAGDGGDNAVRGGPGDDQLFGRQGADLLRGFGGDDELRPGVGADLMRGGAGGDTFVLRWLRPGDEPERDVILDFETARDVIDLSAIDANRTEPGNQAFRWLGSGHFGADPGGLRFGDGCLLGDVDGDGRADVALDLTGVHSLPFTDNILL